MLKRLALPLNLQFFADNEKNSSNGSGNEGQNDQDNVDDGNGIDNDGDNDDSGNENVSNKKNEKMFTQEQVNAMMAREKNQGKKSVLKALGFNSEDDAKKAFNLFKALMDSQKSEEERNKSENETLRNEKQDAEDRAMLAEAKLSCVIAGVNKESIDDVITIALSKITDDENLEKVLEKMKKETRYSSFFSNSQSSGTGRTPGHSNEESGKPGSYGERLAKAMIRKENKEFKSNFF